VTDEDRFVLGHVNPRGHVVTRRRRRRRRPRGALLGPVVNASPSSMPPDPA
jgi:hypothetical protein